MKVFGGSVKVIVCGFLLMVMLAACAGHAQPGGADQNAVTGATPSVSTVPGSPAPSSTVPAGAVTSPATESIDTNQPHSTVDATCMDLPFGDLMKEIADKGSASIILGRLSVTGKSATRTKPDFAYTSVTVEVDQVLGGADPGASPLDAWVLGGVDNEGIPLVTNPTATASWSPDGTAWMLLSPIPDFGWVVRSLPLVDGQVMFSDFECFRTADLATVATTIQRQYLSWGKVVTETTDAQAFPAAKIADFFVK